MSYDMPFTEEDKIGIFRKLGLDPKPTVEVSGDRAYRYHIGENIYIEHIYFTLQEAYYGFKHGHYYVFNISGKSRHWTSPPHHISLVPSLIFEFYHLGYLQNIDNKIYNDYIEENFL